MIAMSGTSWTVLASALFIFVAAWALLFLRDTGPGSLPDSYRDTVEQRRLAREEENERGQR